MDGICEYVKPYAGGILIVDCLNWRGQNVRYLVANSRLGDTANRSESVEKWALSSAEVICYFLSLFMCYKIEIIILKTMYY